MNFQIAGPGRSFKGAMAYYLHDKRPAGSEEQVLTRERVAWTETRNLMTDDPDRATRIMIGTAERSEELKAQAGIARTGRKGTQPVMAYSLAWHPGEAAGLDRDEMVRAAEASLTVLGLERHQAVLVAHRDTAHPHVHVIVNRVSPEDGRYATITPANVRALDRWAHDYERARAHIVSPNRAEKYERIDERRRRHPDPEARRAHVAERARATEERRVRGASRAAELREAGEAMRARHKAEWAAFEREARAERKAVWARYEVPIREAYARAKEDAKPLWKEQFRREREAAWQRRKMERSVFGTVGLALAASWQERRHSPHGKDWSMTALTLVNLVSRGHRERVFGMAAERDRAKIATRQKAMTAERVAGLKAERAGEAGRAGERIAERRQALIDRQNGERAAQRKDWREAGRGQGRRSAGERAQVAAKRDDPFAAFDRERAGRAQGGDPFVALDRQKGRPAAERAGQGLGPWKVDDGWQSQSRRNQSGAEASRAMVRPMRSMRCIVHNTYITRKREYWRSTIAVAFNLERREHSSDPDSRPGSCIIDLGKRDDELCTCIDVGCQVSDAVTWSHRTRKIENSYFASPFAPPSFTLG